MKKIAFVAFIGIGVLFGLDYSKMSDQELINQAGKFPSKEVLEYYQEIDKRSQKMTKEQSREFFFKINEAKIKAEEQMLVKDLRQRKREIRQILADAKDRSYLYRSFRKLHPHKGCDMRDCNQQYHRKMRGCAQNNHHQHRRDFSLS